VALHNSIATKNGTHSELIFLLGRTCQFDGGGIFFFYIYAPARPQRQLIGKGLGTLVPGFSPFVRRKRVRGDLAAGQCHPRRDARFSCDNNTAKQQKNTCILIRLGAERTQTSRKASVLNPQRRGDFRSTKTLESLFAQWKQISRFNQTSDKLFKNPNFLRKENYYYIV